VAISLVGSHLEEILLVYMREIEARYAISVQFISYGLNIKWLQVDNQAFDWNHPMLLYPSVLTRSQKELKEHPFLSFGAIQSRDRSYGVTNYKYLGLLIQEMSLEVGEETLRQLLNFANLSVLVAEPKA
jgi:vacuolar protein sorting-associated protein 13A/C